MDEEGINENNEPTGTEGTTEEPEIVKNEEPETVQNEEPGLVQSEEPQTIQNEGEPDVTPKQEPEVESKEVPEVEPKGEEPEVVPKEGEPEVVPKEETEVAPKEGEPEVVPKEETEVVAKEGEPEIKEQSETEQSAEQTETEQTTDKEFDEVSEITDLMDQVAENDTGIQKGTPSTVEFVIGDPRESTKVAGKDTLVLAMENIEEDDVSGDESDEGVREAKKEKKKKEKEVTEKIASKHRSSISYDMGPRIKGQDGDDHVEDDFLEEQKDVPIKFYKYMDEKDGEEAQEESVSEEEEVTIDRVPYYEKHKSLSKEITAEKVKNHILQKKLAKLFRRRKLDHVLKESDQQFDTQEKYGKKLDAYGQLYDLDCMQRTTITNELESLKLERETKCEELKKLFEDLQNQEKNTGYGLIHSKTGNPIPDKLVERLLQRQRNQMQTVGDMRLKHIQLKNMVAEKQNAIASLDKIGENLYLMDYEQLKVENRSYMDKMEEKDEELTRLRTKCQKTIQILAHMREKSAALDSDIYDLTDDLMRLDNTGMAIRGMLNGLKQQRDYYRNMTNKLRDESGLLTQTDLLRDMESSMAELKTVTEELELLKEEHKIKAQQIRNIRKNIEFTPESLIKRAQKDVTDRKIHGKNIYKGRPSLHKPTLPGDAFKHLKNFKGKPTYDKYEKKTKQGNIYIC